MRGRGRESFRVADPGTPCCGWFGYQFAEQFTKKDAGTEPEGFVMEIVQLAIAGA